MAIRWSSLECVKDALETARTVILREYIRSVEFLSDCLSSSSRQAARFRGDTFQVGAL